MSAIDGVEAGVGTICMAVYRPDPELLAVQVDSIKAQTVRSWHCFIGIDGDDERTRALVIEAIGDDPRFSVLAFEENVGFYRNFERLLAAVDPTSAWVALADQDDRWYPEKLETLLPGLADASLVTGAARVVNTFGVASGVTARSYRGLTALMIDNQVTGSLAVFRRELLDVAMPFPEPTDVAYHDHWLGVAAASTGGVILDQRVVQDYVQHDANVIGEESADSTLTSRSLALRRSGGSTPWAMLAYLRRHRWGWRVNMANALVRRVEPASDVLGDELNAFDRGRVTCSLAFRLLRLASAGDVPKARAFALMLAGAVPGTSGALSRRS